jgi:hypothetical protein|tara:strand:+ start:382 stop:594 length:213 start_codon:yes stop_codon:yes gene_type:complete
MLITKPDQINAFRLLALQKALKLELKGLKVSRGISAYKIIKEEFNLKGNKQKVLDQYTKILQDNNILQTV